SAKRRTASMRTVPACTAAWISRSTKGASPARSRSIALPTRSWLVMAIEELVGSGCEMEEAHARVAVKIAVERDETAAGGTSERGEVGIGPIPGSKGELRAPPGEELVDTRGLREERGLGEGEPALQRVPGRGTADGGAPQHSRIGEVTKE